MGTRSRNSAEVNASVIDAIGGASANVDSMSSATAVAQGQENYDDWSNMFDTSWWNKITGGDVEKNSQIAQMLYQNKFSADQAQLGRIFEAQQAAYNRLFNSAQADKQRRWETNMSNTAYTRAMQDMKNAGLNPALMYAKGGMSASTPTGASAQGSQGRSGTTPRGTTPTPLHGNTGQLAGIIGAVAFSSAKAIQIAMSKTAMSNFDLGTKSGWQKIQKNIQRGY